MKKRIFSMLLAIVMVVGLVPSFALTASAAEAVASVTVDGTTTNYTTLADAIAAVANCTADDNAVVTILADIALGDSNQTITSGVFTIDLNGKNITCNIGIFLIKNSGTKVTLVDSTETDGTVSSTGTTTDVVSVLSGAEVIIEGGKFKGGTAVFVTDSSSSATIKGGEFSSIHRRAVTNCGTLVIESGQFNAGSWSAVCASSGSVTIKGGTFTAGFYGTIEYYGGVLDLSAYFNPTGISVSNGTDAAVTPSDTTIKLPSGYCFYDSSNNAAESLAVNKGYTIGAVTTSGGETTSTTISLGQTELILAKGKSNRIIATVSPEATAAWSSGDDSIATVDGNGRVTAVGVGSTTITATVGTVSKSCTVYVYDVILNPTSLELTVGGEAKELAVTVKVPAGIELSQPPTKNDYSSGAISIGDYRWGTDNGTVIAAQTYTYPITPVREYSEFNLAITVNMKMSDNSGETGYVTVNCPVVVNAASVPKETYSVNIGTITNGTVTANKTSAVSGDAITLTVSPDTNYVLDTLTVGGTDVTADVSDNKYTFKMPANDVTVTATFKRVYKIIIADNIENGTLTADKYFAAEGELVTLTATPNEGYEKGPYTTAVTGYVSISLSGDVMTMPACDVTVSVKFVSTSGYKIQKSANAGSTVTLTYDTYPIPEGGSYTVTVKIWDGYVRGENYYVTINGKNVANESNVYVVENVTSNQTVFVGGIFPDPTNTAFKEGGNYPFTFVCGDDDTHTVNAPYFDADYAELGEMTGSMGAGVYRNVTFRVKDYFEDTLSDNHIAADILPETAVFRARWDITTKTWYYVNAATEYDINCTYTVTVTNDGNGTAAASVSSAASGTEITLTATPNTGYRFKEWQVVSGGVTVTDNKFTLGTANVEIEVVFEAIPVITYDLWIGGVQVTSANLSGTGWTYAPDTNTLTLNGADIVGVSSADAYKSAAIYAELDALKIVVAGNSTITGATATKTHSAGIYACGALTITGEGTLTVMGGAAGNNNPYGTISAGISAASGKTITITGAKVIAKGCDALYRSGVSSGIVGSVLVIDNSTVNAVGGTTGTEGSPVSAGIGGSGNMNLTVNGNSVVNATGAKRGIHLYGGNFTVNGGEVTITSTASDAFSANGTKTINGGTVICEGAEGCDAISGMFTTTVAGKVIRYTYKDGTSTTNWQNDSNQIMASNYIKLTVDDPDPIYHTITLYTYGGVVTDTDKNVVEAEAGAKYTIQYKEGNGAELPDYVKREGHTFKGWYDAQTGGVGPYGSLGTGANYSMTFHAQYNANTHDIIYIVDGEEYDRVEDVAYDSKVTLIDAPTKTGYTFSGWSTAPATMPDEDVTVEGTFTPNTYTVSFDTNGGEAIAPITVTYGEKYGRLPSSAVTGLSGGDSNWYLVDENGVVTDTKITKLSKVTTARNHTLKVVRTVLAPTLKITLKVPGGISDGYQYYIPDNSTRILTVTVNNQNSAVLDYTYQWYKDGTAIDGATKAVLTLDGNVSDSGTYKVVVTATLNNGTGIAVTASSASGEKEQVVKIMHAANTLSYDANGGENAPGSHYTGGDSITVASGVPSREGYAFAGWNTSADGKGDGYHAGDTYTFADVNGSGGWKVTLYAQWAECYSIWVGGVQVTGVNKDDVLSDGGSVKYDPDTSTLIMKDAVIKNPEGSGIYAENINLIIDGMDTDAAGENTIGGTDVTETGVDEDGYEYTETPPGNGIEVQNGSLTIIGTLGDITSGEIGDGIMVAGDVTITGTVGKITGGVAGIYADGVLTIDNTAVLLVAEDGYAFAAGKGYLLTDVIISSPEVYDLGSIEMDTDVWYTTIGTSNWTDDGDSFTPASSVSFEPGYTVSFYDSLGDGTHEQGIPTGKTARKPADPTYEGYTFEGWYTSSDDGETLNEKYDFATPVTGEISLYAKWTASTYAVVLVANGGTIHSGNVTEYTYGVGALLPTNVTRSGHYFGGWYDNEACKGAPVTEISTTDIGNKTFYAKWDVDFTPFLPLLIKYDVKVANGIVGGVVTTDKTSASANDKVNITVVPVEGYVINTVIVTDEKGNTVTVTANGEGKYSFKMPMRDVTVYAVFDKTEVPVTPATCPKDHTCPIWKFPDAQTTEWYHDGVHFCIENNLMNGFEDGTFQPNTTTTRAMIVTILWRLEGKPIQETSADFFDVSAGQWYTDAIHWASANGIVLGYGDGTFGPNDVITREQLATILYRYAQYKGGGFTGAWMIRMDYVDLADVSDWAYEAMCWMNMNGVVNGKPGKILDPKGSATRAEAATMLYRYCEVMAKEDND